ncbi:MAG: DNA topoisomerase 1 [Phycisphaerae bacterium]|jgi:DNA topoisomerase-1|nr:MAG: DNA topoisomerase 1 [Phycisphaerae bacterium]
MAKKKNGKHLVIVESPAKAKTINRYLGDDFIVKASMGHVRDLLKGEKAIDLNTFTPRYEIIKERGKEKVVSELKKLAKSAPDVYLATDLDREGEAIAWHLKEALGLDDDVKRVIFNAITKTEIQKAFANPHKINMDRVNAQQARRILDRIVGYEISPVLWRKVARKLSAGRVQSVAVRLVVDREREIETFIPEEFWRITGIFTNRLEDSSSLMTQWREWSSSEHTKADEDKWLREQGCLRAELIEVDGQKFEPNNKDQTRQVAEALGFVVQQEQTVPNPDGKGPARQLTHFFGSIDQPGRFDVRSIEKKRATSRPPGPFITSTLQQSASNRLYMSAKRTMQIAQILYEAGHITYMRTDSTHLSTDAIQMARDHIRAEFGDRYVPERPNVYASSNKNAQEAHEAIRPTDLAFTPELASQQLKEDESKLYRLIYNRFVACQMSPAEFDQTAVQIVTDTRLGPVVFRATGRKLVFDGFMKVAGIPSDDQLLPDLQEGSRLFAIDIRPTQHFTQPPPRFTEASLVKELESNGVGRPSTYASIISTILERKYVAMIDRRLYPTLLGRVVTDKLMQAFPEIMDVGFTAEMEDKLDKIEEQHLDWIRLLQDFYGPFHQTVEGAIEKLDHAGGMESGFVCEKCGKPMLYRISSNGFFLACSDRECGTTKPVDEFGKPVLREESEFKCPKCGRVMIRRKGKFGEYLSCSGYSEKDDQGNPVCSMIVPVSKSGEPEAPKIAPVITDILCEKDQAPMLLRHSKRGPFLGCSRFPKCRSTKMLKNLTPEQIRTIEKLLPELRKRVQESFEQASRMTGKPVESFGRLPQLQIVSETTDEPKPNRGRRSKKVVAS